MLGEPQMFLFCSECDSTKAFGEFELMNYSISRAFTLVSDQSVCQCYFSVVAFGCKSELSMTFGARVFHSQTASRQKTLPFSMNAAQREKSFATRGKAGPRGLVAW